MNTDSESPPSDSKRGKSSQCNSQLHNHQLTYKRMLFLWKISDAEKIKLLISHGDFTEDKVTKTSNSRALPICDLCIKNAELETSDEHKTFLLLTDIMQKLDVLGDTSSARNTDLVSMILYKLARSQSKNLDSIINGELCQPKTHKILREESSEVVFLSKSVNNVAIVKSLLGFACLPSEMVDGRYEMMAPKKIQALCAAYEAVLSLKHSKVTTPPAVMKNLRLYKFTHNQSLLDKIGAPSGGRKDTLKGIMKSELPQLMPPLNDFVTTDDNLQIKRVTSSSRLKEQFKHTVKVVNSHVHFQNKKDKVSSVLKNENNQPRHWLKKPDRECVEKFESKLPTYEKAARKVRGSLVAKWLEEEIKAASESLDLVGKLVRLRSSRPNDFNVYPCPCGGEVRDVCEDCGFDANNLVSGDNPYKFCPKGPRNGFDVTIGEVGKFNPAGLLNLKLLFDHLRTWNIEMSSSNQAVGISVADGRIFYDGSVVQEQSLTCTDCDVSCDHENMGNHDEHNVEMTYGDTLFVLGWGHLEARFQSAFIQFGWPVMFAESARIFGHRTKGALNYFFQCKDFHKSYAFIAAFSEAATKELLRLFVKEEICLAAKEQRSPVPFNLHEFTKWAANNLQSPRSVWLFSMGFSVGSIIVVLRAAVRNNNVAIAKGALYLLKSLAWSGNLPIYRQCVLRSGIVEEVQAPEELREFLAAHKFGQRNPEAGMEQHLDWTHQGMDMLHEEVIRLEQSCINMKELNKNALTGSFERDDAVFVDAARWLGFYGPKWISSTDHQHQCSRKYPKYFKQVLAMRKQIRTSGFLVGFKNPDLPFYSSDLKTELHPDLHNFKIMGEDNFKQSLRELKEGKAYTELSKPVIPKTVEEAEKIKKRGEKTKEVLFNELVDIVQEAVKQFPSDEYLNDTNSVLEKKTFRSFNPKSQLENLTSEVDGHISKLNFDREFKDAMGKNSNEDESDSDSDNDVDNDNIC